MKVAAVDPRSSIYVGVATKRWARTRGAAQAIRSEECWLLDLRRGRFVHSFPAYDQAARAAHGARARYHATSDDTVVEGDVLGVRVIDGAAHFFRNGRRLAFSAGGRGSNQLQDAGWGRPTLSQDLVPIVEVHAREPDDDDEAMAPLALQLGAWRPPPYYHGQSLQARRILGDDPVRRFNTGEFADVWPSITNDPALRDITQPVPERDQLTFRSLRIVICSVLPLLPLIAGLSHTLLDVGGFGIGVACATWRPAPILWLLGLLFRRAADSIALSLAVSAVWKCHFYDRRRPRRTRRGLRKLLQMHLLKCFGVALCVALLPSSLALSRRASALTSYRDGVVLEYGPMKWILKGGWRGAFETCEKWVIVEAAAEGVFQLWRVLCSSKLAACLCSFPGGESARARTGVGKGRREVVRHDGPRARERGSPCCTRPPSIWQAARAPLARGRRRVPRARGLGGVHGLREVRVRRVCPQYVGGLRGLRLAGLAPRVRCFPVLLRLRVPSSYSSRLRRVDGVGVAGL